MLDFIANALSSQSPSPDSREGLPYWIFWLLLCVILLLVVFIFLRDKSLRQRLNSFFFSIKRKLIKIQLHSKLKKERQKKDELVKELGKRAWKDNIRVSQNEETNKKLDELEKDREKINDDIRDTERQREPLFENLGKTIEELRIEERKLAGLYSQIDKADRRIHGLEKRIQNL